jgi:hypothetical protein
VPLVPGTNPAPDFYMFTEAPVAGHGVGFILDDTATEFNQYAPTFGEKYSPPHLPISIQDWTGREISRVYSDQFGSYNFLVPSSFTINPPFPSGVMPSMMVACMNHPGPIADPSDPTKKVIDPFFNRNYTQFCYTLQYLPGKTTYLDTPVLPISAFASVDKNPLDCECADGTPAIYSATNGDHGPWVPVGGGTLTIISQGFKDVVNPAYDPNVLWPAPAVLSPGYSVATGPDDTRLQKTIKRDYSFGATQGTVTLGGISLPVTNWSADGITVTVPAGRSTGQLVIKRGGANGKETVVGLTLHVGTLLNNAAPIHVNPNATNTTGSPYKTLQAAIDAAADGALITIAPGSYPEFVIMDKRVSLQGWGAGSVTINASKPSAGGLNDWRAKVAKKIDAIPDPTGAIDADTGKVAIIPGPQRTFDALPGQTLGFNGANNEPVLFASEEAPGILVVGRGLVNPLDTTQYLGCALNLLGHVRRIDGVTVTGSDAGGGILASGFACDLQITNNRVVSNYGTYGGGIRIGHTTLTSERVTNGVASLTYTDAFNRRPVIRNNFVAQNGAAEIGGAGGAGGITMGTGSDAYTVSSNYICGNFSMSDGGGMAHLGVSGGANNVNNNKFIFNQTFNQSADPTGGGLFIGGLPPLAGTATEGTGNVNVGTNLFQGNQAGSGAGGGVAIARTLNGDAIRLTNNMIVNNVAAYAGGGVSVVDIGNNVRLANNTLASNISTATNRQSFGSTGAKAPSLPQVAGLAVLPSSDPANVGRNPLLVNNIFWGNRQYIYLIAGLQSGLFNPGSTLNTAGPTPVIVPNNTPRFSDLGRMEAAGPNLAPVNSVLTTGATNLRTTASATNVTVASTDTTLFTKKNDFSSVIDPLQPVVLAADGLVQVASALTFDETGNFINVIFSPLTLWETVAGPNFGTLRADYHLKEGSPAIDKGQVPTANNSVPSTDYDGETRPYSATAPAAFDIGADEFMPRPTLVVTPTAINFGNVSVNTFATQTISVANAGVVGALLTAPTVTGANAGQFTLTNGCPLAPATLDVDGTCTISVRFTPTSNGGKVATVTVNSTNVGSQTVALSGNGVTPLYIITPLVRNFGNQRTGNLSEPVRFTLTNTALSQGELWATGTPLMSGTNANQFQATFGTGDTCTASSHLAIGASCTFSVVFAPTTSGCKGTSVLGVCLIPNTSVDVPKASGTGAAASVIGVAGTATSRTVSGANTLNFATVARGGTSAAQTLTLTNTGFNLIPFTSATFSGANAANWVQTNTCAAGIPVNGSCTVSVAFKPLAAPATTGAKNSSLTIVDGVGNTTRTVNGTAGP